MTNIYIFWKRILSACLPVYIFIEKYFANGPQKGVTFQPPEKNSKNWDTNF